MFHHNIQHPKLPMGVSPIGPSELPPISRPNVPTYGAIGHALHHWGQGVQGVCGERLAAALQHPVPPKWLVYKGKSESKTDLWGRSFRKSPFVFRSWSMFLSSTSNRWGFRQEIYTGISISNVSTTEMWRTKDCHKKMWVVRQERTGISRIRRADNIV